MIDCVKNKGNDKCHVSSTGGSRTAATSKMERFVIIVNGFQPLTIITKHPILDVIAVLDPSVSSKRNEFLNQKIKHETYFYDESNYYYCSCRFFAKKVFYANTSLPLLKKD